MLIPMLIGARLKGDLPSLPPRRICRRTALAVGSAPGFATWEPQEE